MAAGPGASVADEVIDPVGAVAGWVQHAANHPVGFQDPLLDKTIQYLLDLRPEPDEHGILQFLDLRREVLQQVLLSKGVLVMSGELRYRRPTNTG